ncbi:MAG: HEAT repeat domain-containing protein [Tolypothrix sp. T3-bin4]|nr:HEAT repeat domain-containing protein [Tolypothrix sp. T3-bin4]
MNKHSTLPFLGMLRVCLLGVAFPLLLTSHNWAQANTKQNNGLVYTQTPVQSTDRLNIFTQEKKINPPFQDKQQEQEGKSDKKKQDPPWTVTAAVLGIVVVVYLGILRFYPLLLLRLPTELKVPKTPITPVELKIPVGFVIWLKYRPEVLDAWVAKQIDIFEKKFLKNETVDECKDYVSLPVLLDKHEIEELKAEHLRETFAQEKRVRLLIWGEGGSGKTTISCQIARWAMEKDKSKRLTTHFMLPVLIEQELDSQGEGIKPLIEEIMRQIQELIDSEQKIIDELLVEQLLRKRRILLIVDHFSEMSQQTREKINPELSEFPANALVVTSRIEEKFKGIDIDITTLRFDGGKLAYFTEQYLKQRDKWKLFEEDQEEFLQGCAQLASIVGNKKTITVLLAKLYAERMINGKENSSLNERSLDNIPELIIDHLRKLNREVERRTAEEYHTIEQDAKLIAWKCLEQNYKPSYVERNSVIHAWGKEKADKALEHFERKLFLIKSGRTDTIRFTLDPLAEYLAGLYLVENFNENEVSWREFLAKVYSNLDKQEEIKGFLFAVRECCITKGAAAKVPSFVAEELGKLAGLDLEALKQEQQKQRIRRLIHDLYVPEVEDRRRAVNELGKIAAADKSAVEGLLIALKNPDLGVRRTAAEALSKLDNTSDIVVKELLARLQDDDFDVRRYITAALLKLDNTSELLLQGLLVQLEDKDNNVDVRRDIAEALGKLSNASEPVLDRLLARLQDKDDDVHVRRNTAWVLGKLGNTSESVLQGLLKRLQDKADNVYVRRNATEALGKLCNASESVLQGLLERLQDKDDDVYVRRNAIEALGKLGNASKSVLQELLARLEDANEHYWVREEAVKALEKLGNSPDKI